MMSGGTSSVVAIDAVPSQRTITRWVLVGATAVAMGGVIRWWWKRRSRIGVQELFIYPIKSCKEVPVKIATVTALGFRGDRVFQVNDAEGRHCTPRDKAVASLFRICCSLTDDTLQLSMPRSGSSAPQLEVDLRQPTSTVRVTCEGLSAAPRPDGDRETLQDYGDEAAAWLSAQIGVAGLRLSGIGSGSEYRRVIIVNPKQGDLPTEGSVPLSLADEAPFLLTSAASLKELNRHLRERQQPEVTMERFRPNIVVAGTALQPWEEDTWKRVRIGGVDFQVWQRCARCEMITIDRDSLKRDTEPLKTLASFRKRKGGGINFGMHMIPCSGLPAGGVDIYADQELVILEYDEHRRAEWVRLSGMAQQI